MCGIAGGHRTRFRRLGMGRVTDTAMQAAILILVLILPLSALLARRVPLRTTLIYGGIWVAITALLAMFILTFT